MGSKTAAMTLHTNRELEEFMATCALPTSTVHQVPLDLDGWEASAEIIYPPIYKKEEGVKYPAVIFMYVKSRAYGKS
jgi:hypothetical protein